MRVKYKPKPKIPAGSVPRERETTPSAELRKEATTATGEQITTPSPANETSSRTKEMKELRTSQEPSIIPITPTSCTSTVSMSAVICSVETADTVSNSYSTSATILTELGISPITSSRTRCDVSSDLETSHLAADTIRTSSGDCLNVTSSAVSDNDRQSSSIYCHPGTSEQLNSSPSFGECFPCAVQAESIPILCDDDSVEDTSIDSNRTIILQPSSSQYPSFIESLSSSVLSQVASSHRVLGLDQPSNGDLVTGNAVATTYKKRFCEDSDVDEDDEEMDVFDNCPDDRSATGSSNSSHLQQTEIAGEVEVGNDEDNEAVAKDGNDDNGGNKTKTKSKRRRKQPEPKKKRKGPQKAKEAPDVSKMTMSELTKYNPKANPMQSTVEARRRRKELKKAMNGVNTPSKNASTTSSQSSSTGVAEQQKEKSPGVEAAYEEENLNSRLVPQLTIGEDGQIILNEKSLTVEATPVERELDSDVVYESSSSYTTSHRYSKKPFYIKNWDEKETQRFYEILSKTGTDFTMMTVWFPKRTRMEIKRKFKREEKRNPSKISQALKRITPVSMNKPSQENV